MAIKQITNTPSTSPEGKSIAKIREVRGKSLVWNQLANNSIFPNGTRSGLLFGHDADGTITINGTASTIETISGWLGLPVSNPIPGSHKLYISRCLISGSVLGTWGFDYNPNQTTRGEQNEKFILNGSAANSKSIFWFHEGCVFTNAKIALNVIDLTLLFGAGNEPTTVEEFESLFPLPYYAYNPGEIISNKTEQVKVVGFNQWDEEWESGAYASNNGQKVTSNDRIRSKNYIPILPNVSYYRSKGLQIYYYDAEYNYLNWLNSSIAGIFTPIANARYMTFNAMANTGATYKNDICINISDPTRNGTYKPYKKSTLPLNISTLTGKLNGEGESVTIFPNGMRSAGSAYDRLIIDPDGFARRAVRVMESVDLGTLTWAKNGDWFVTNGLNSSGGRPNIAICEKYIISGASVVYNKTEDKVMFCGKSGYFDVNRYQVYVYDTSYNSNTAADFKAAMSGVELIYELATPLEYVLDTPILMEYNTDGGTEQIVFSENLLSTPLVADVDYFNTAIKHIQFSDETHCIRDERITGVDYIPTEHSTNVVTSAGVYKAISGFSTTDTKNTTGSTDTSSKIFLVGATTQAANPQTYSDNEIYATSGVLTTKSVQVGGTSATMQYNSTDSSIEFVFS